MLRYILFLGFSLGKLLTEMAPFRKAPCKNSQKHLEIVESFSVGQKSPATRNRTRDHLMAACVYSQMLYQLSYSRDTSGDFIRFNVGK